jgi:hypothetical protein
MISTQLRQAGIAALALWTAVAQAVPPQHITLTYEMKRNGIVLGDVSETLKHDGRTYAITSELKGRSGPSPASALDPNPCAFPGAGLP